MIAAPELEQGGFRRAAVALGVLSALSLAALGASSCGPSVQSIYEGDVRFEHCYRLDLDLNIAPTHREACWKQWLTSYTYGQPRDRIEYARRRVRAFGSGDLSRPSLDTNSNSVSARRQFYLVVPEPTSAHASPPPLATAVPSALPSDAPAPETPRTPSANCTSACESAWRSCKNACAPDGGASETACKSCEPDYKRCMKRCFD